MGASSTALKLPLDAGPAPPLRVFDPALPSLADQFVTGDEGRVALHRDWLPVFEAHGLTTFDAWFSLTGGEPIRAVKQRRTTRFTLSGDTPLTLYLKRHEPLPWTEYVRSALKLNWPSNGARPEWEAHRAFHAAGLRIATPVAFGEHNGRSLLATKALDGFVSLRDVFSRPVPESEARSLVREAARVARKMHAASLCHQDFYFDHLLVPPPGRTDGLHVIDLGRVRHSDWTGRWRLKDLAQILYSLLSLEPETQTAFLEEYLGRPLHYADEPWLALLAVKTWWIARHTRRRGL
jgi:hypothetical protein